ncbi:hypothetical protein GCM10010435_97090 [Winogradskya consettensis]|uniref:Ricin B lectin domain-containing protein n=1 Tax=Winogradskya consettensis TaxID=113560 RepID=A0A919VZH9_9ACTN|nr:RICIN domain-containing protein [Actinoplanes consettensis]GIM85328.1 hypothetical protein Aco04nite_95770 [Actinoplanes consettensis]
MKRVRLFVASAAILLGLVAAGLAPAQVAMANSGDVLIVNDHADKCVDVVDASTAIGALVQEWDCTKKSEQQWTRASLSNGWWQMASRKSALCLDVRGGQAVAGARVDQELCDATELSQQWRITPGTNGFWVMNRLGMCLALSPNTSKNGTPIVIDWCSDTSAKYWYYALL